MSEPFNPYISWLGISKEDLPPNHYQILGLKNFETDTAKIKARADKLHANIKKLSKGESKHANTAQALLEDISAARTILLSDSERGKYDASLMFERTSGKEAGEERFNICESAKSEAVPILQLDLAVEKSSVPDSSSKVPSQSAGSSLLPIVALTTLVVAVAGGSVWFLAAKSSNKPELASVETFSETDDKLANSEDSVTPKEKTPKAQQPEESKQNPGKSEARKTDGVAKTLKERSLLVDFNTISSVTKSDLSINALETDAGIWKTDIQQKIYLGMNSNNTQKRIIFWDGKDNHLVLLPSDAVDRNGKIKLTVRRCAPNRTNFKFGVATQKGNEAWKPLKLSRQPGKNRGDIVVNLNGEFDKIRFTSSGPDRTEKLQKWLCGMTIFKAEFIPAN